MRNFQNLDVWKDGRLLVHKIYILANSLPLDEKFGLVSQIKRCVIPLPSNIAEGCAKDSQKDFARFLQISLGSCFELESHLILCADLKMITSEDATDNILNLNELKRKIYALIKYANTQT